MIYLHPALLFHGKFHLLELYILQVLLQDRQMKITRPHAERLNAKLIRPTCWIEIYKNNNYN